MLVAQLPATPLDDLLLDPARRNQPTLRPQTIREVEHGREGFGVVFPERMAPFCHDAVARPTIVGQRRDARHLSSSDRNLASVSIDQGRSPVAASGGGVTQLGSTSKAVISISAALLL